MTRETLATIKAAGRRIVGMALAEWKAGTDMRYGACFDGEMFYEWQRVKKWRHEQINLTKHAANIEGVNHDLQ